MATFTKFYVFAEDLGKAIHNFSTPDPITIGLWVPGSPTPPQTGDTVVDTTTGTCTLKAVTNILEIAAGNGYTKKGIALSTISWAQSGGVGRMAVSTDPVWTASGGTMASFRYLVIYNDNKGTTSTRPAIGWFDYGSTVSLGTGETFTIDIDQSGSGGLLTIT